MARWAAVMPKAAFADRMKMHQQRLHDALKLTPQQEGAWSKFQESHPFASNAKRPEPIDFSKPTAPERAEKMLEMQKTTSGSDDNTSPP